MRSLVGPPMGMEISLEGDGQEPFYADVFAGGVCVGTVEWIGYKARYPLPSLSGVGMRDPQFGWNLRIQRTRTHALPAFLWGYVQVPSLQAARCLAPYLLMELEALVAKERANG